VDVVSVFAVASLRLRRECLSKTTTAQRAALHFPLSAFCITFLCISPAAAYLVALRCANDRGKEKTLRAACAFTCSRCTLVLTV